MMNSPVGLTDEKAARSSAGGGHRVDLFMLK